MRAAGALLAFAAALSVAGAGQVIRNQPLPLPGGQGGKAEQGAAVQFVYPEQVTVAAGHAAQIDLHFHIADGLHINSHTPLDKSLIPARLAVVEPAGLHVSSVEFPAGTAYALQVAPRDKLSVYTGDFVLRAHLTATPGEHLLTGALRYQACDSNACMPPHTIPVDVTVLAQ